jgi:cardiolipin synthase
VDVTNHIPLWLTILLISRDVVIVGVVAIVNLAVGPRTFRPSFLGKLATATYLLVSIVFMYFNWRGERSWIVNAAVYLALAVTLVSSADYFVRMRKLINEGH